MAAVPRQPFVSVSTTPENPERGLDAIPYHFAKSAAPSNERAKGSPIPLRAKAPYPLPIRKRDALGKMARPAAYRKTDLFSLPLSTRQSWCG